MTIAKQVLNRICEMSLEQYKDIGQFLKDLIDTPKDFAEGKGYYDGFLRWFEKTKSGLKKPVVSAWFLKIVAIHQAVIYLNNRILVEEESDPNILLIKKKIHKIKKGMYDDVDIFSDIGVKSMFNYFLQLNLHTLFNNLTHFLSFNYDEISGFNYAGKTIDQVMKEMEAIVEKKSVKNAKFLINDTQESNLYKGKIDNYLVFPNGWKWVWKHFHKCELESKYGGKHHCGTARSGDELLSLREPIGSDFYKIWATFSIDDEGYLVQRKGTTEETDETTGKIIDRFGNKKPEPAIHKYIIQLLRHGYENGDIKGFVSSSEYLTENDFRLEDLQDSKEKEYLEGVLDVKEAYENIEDEYDANGMTDRVRDEISGTLGVEFDSYDRGANWYYTIDDSNFSTFHEGYFGLINALTNREFEFPTKQHIEDTVKEILNDTGSFENTEEFENYLGREFGHTTSILLTAVVNIFVSSGYRREKFNAFFEIPKTNEELIDLHRGAWDGSVQDFVIKHRLDKVKKILQGFAKLYTDLGFLGIFFKRLQGESSITTDDNWDEKDAVIESINVGVNDYNLWEAYLLNESEYDTVTSLLPWDFVRNFDSKLRFMVSCSLYNRNIEAGAKKDDIAEYFTGLLESSVSGYSVMFVLPGYVYGDGDDYQ